MTKGQMYLKIVLEKLNTKIAEMGTMIQEVQKDIVSMNDYYWENYTEMDQYGYENFDNRRALMTQVTTNEENRRTLQGLHKMCYSPFFGSVEFLYDGDEKAEQFYIGIGNFAEFTGSRPMVYDWRAPVSGLFYNYDKGEASYQAPGGVMPGEILSKWQYKIRDGQMIYEFESDVKIDDEILKQELGENGDAKLKNIVRTIQKEQNSIIRNTADRILVIQGAAGSGKTSVALHRIAYLLYHDREHLKSSNILVLSPNSVFSDYISHVLPELGEEHIREMSFDLFAYHELKDIVGDCEDRYHYIERQLLHPDKEENDRYWWKQSADFIGVIEGFLVLLEDDLVQFKTFDYRGFHKSAQEIMELFYFKFSQYPLLSRMEAVMEYIVDEYETLYRRTIAEEELLLIQEWFMSMYETRDIYQIYNRMLEENASLPLPEIAPQHRMLAYEDVYPMLYLKQKLLTTKKHKQIRHLVIDEMQDYSYLQYVILENMFSCRMTILGDRAQTMDDQPRDVMKFLPKIFGKDLRKIEMKRSYRNTVEIAEYANKYSAVKEIEYLERHGREVMEISCNTEQEAKEKVCRKLCEESRRFETTAILTMTETQAKSVYEYLSKTRDDVSYIDRDSTLFQKGVTVTTYYLAKGLEFDRVLIFGGDQNHAFFPQFRYISATRALHELYIYNILS